MTDSNLTPKCPDCSEPMKRDEAMCQCIELKLPGMEFHRAQPLARRILYLEGLVDILLAREAERNRKRKPRAAKRAERAS